MPCSPKLPGLENYDSSDYGSDFTPDEEELLNDLLSKAVASPATADANSIAVAKQQDLESLQPAVLAALVADVEDGIEGPPSVRLPKVLGREKPRSPWRQASQRPWFGPGASSGAAAGRASQDADNRGSPLGMSALLPPSISESRFRVLEPG